MEGVVVGDIVVGECRDDAESFNDCKDFVTRRCWSLCRRMGVLGRVIVVAVVDVVVVAVAEDPPPLLLSLLGVMVVQVTRTGLSLSFRCCCC